MHDLEVGPGYYWEPLDLPTDTPLPLLSPRPLPQPSTRALSAQEVEWLRIGLGRSSMDIKWMFRPGSDNILRLFRSWTGSEMYRARLVPQRDHWIITEVWSESDPRRDDSVRKGLLSMTS